MLSTHRYRAATDSLIQELGKNFLKAVYSASVSSIYLVLHGFVTSCTYEHPFICNCFLPRPMF